MKKKVFVFLAWAMLLVFLAVPAAADDLQLQINDGRLSGADLYLAGDYSMIGLDSFAFLLGADVAWNNAEEFLIREDGFTLTMALGYTEARASNGTVLSLPVAPWKSGERVYFPLRATAGAFGFTVDWDGTQNLVLLNRAEKLRDGLTAAEMIVKSNEAVKEVNTYSYDGDATMKVGVQAGEEPPEQIDVTVKLSGQIQLAPFKTYLTITMAELATGEVMVAETYLDEKGIYLKTPDTTWEFVEMPLSEGIAALESSSIFSDPLRAAALLKEANAMFTFGNDQTIEGQNYYVINSAIGPDGMKQILAKVLGSVSDLAPADLSDEAAAELVSLFENMQLDFKYTTLINPETYFCETVNYDATLLMTMKAPDETGVMQQMSMEMFMKGAYKIPTYNQPFISPDLSGAVKAGEAAAPEAPATEEGATEAADPAEGDPEATDPEAAEPDEAKSEDPENENPDSGA